MSQSPTSGTPSGSAPVDPPRRGRPAWLIPLIAGIVVLLLLLLLLTQCGGDDSADGDADAGAGAGAGATSTATAPSPTASAEASATPSVTIEDTATPTSSPASTPTTSGDGSSATAGATDGADDAGADATLVTAGGTSVLALVADSPTADLASVDGQDVQATGVAVESVPADEGFWVGSGDQRVWAQLDGQGESSFEIEAGEQLDFAGEVVANDQAFLDQLTLVGAEDGLTQLQQQGYHLLVDRDTVEAVG